MLQLTSPFLVLLVALDVALATSVPSASIVGSDLTFLLQNDLNWPTIADHNSTILINKPSTNAEALASCKMLNEALLPTAGIHFQDDIKSITSYLATPDGGRFSNNQQFWVASSPATHQCAAVSSRGGVQSVSCNAKLPAFCSSSAPHRRNIETDLSDQFHVQVKSKKLTVVGTRDHLSFRFIGIPFADPFDRFTYSKVFSSSASLTALAYGSRCTQSGGGSEDCLFLNVYTPFLPVDGEAAKSKGSLKPVLVWIHGGAFTGGEASDGIFDGGNMVSRSDVVLGTLGFLALGDGVTNGNFGIADQVTALQWIQEHIADFGGDPSRITIHGQSAGAGSVRALLAAKPAFGLFQGAIAQSNLGGFGFASTYSKYFTIEQEIEMFAAPLLQSVGCAGLTGTATLDCLRKIPAQTLLNVPTAPKFIVVDGKFITTDQLELNGSGPVANAHVIFGWMRDDGSDFIGNFPTSTSTLTTQLLAAGLSSDVTAKVANSTLFPMPNALPGANAGNGTPQLNALYNLTSRVGTDGEFRCIDQATVSAAAKHNTFPSVFAYQFDRSYAGFEPIPGTCEPPATAAFPNGDPSLPYFRCHSGELYYMFGNMGQDLKPIRDANDILMSQVSVDAWGAFARTFDPNPSSTFLQARGYDATAKVLKDLGPWKSITKSNADGKGKGGSEVVRILDVPFSNAGFTEVDQCSLLGFPLNMYD